MWQVYEAMLLLAGMSNKGLEWKDKENGGQLRKKWCKLKCGEEDVDWCITEVPGKGLGMVAKRAISSKARILVEAPCTTTSYYTHPGVRALMHAPKWFD